jgi:hypothetical protein
VRATDTEHHPLVESRFEWVLALLDEARNYEERFVGLGKLSWESSRGFREPPAKWVVPAWEVLANGRATYLLGWLKKQVCSRGRDIKGLLDPFHRKLHVHCLVQRPQDVQQWQVR